MFLFLPKVYYGMLEEVSKSMRGARFFPLIMWSWLKTFKSVYPRNSDFTKIDDNITHIIAPSSHSFFFAKFYFYTLIIILIVYQQQRIRRTLILNPWWWSIFLFFVLFIYLFYIALKIWIDPLNFLCKYFYLMFKQNELTVSLQPHI